MLFKDKNDTFLLCRNLLQLVPPNPDLSVGNTDPGILLLSKLLFGSGYEEKNLTRILKSLRCNWQRKTEVLGQPYMFSVFHIRILDPDPAFNLDRYLRILTYALLSKYFHYTLNIFIKSFFNFYLFCCKKNLNFIEIEIRC